MHAPEYFSPDWYCSTYPDVAQSPLEPLEHFARHGRHEYRSPGPLFDALWYVHRYPDIVKSRVDPLLHFVEFGIFELRDPNPFFDATTYQDFYPDCSAKGQTPWQDFLEAAKGDTAARWRGVVKASSQTTAFQVDRMIQAFDAAPRSKAHAMDQGTSETIVLVAENRLPRFDQDSGSMRMYGIIQELVKLGCTVIFFAKQAEEPGEENRYIRALHDLGVHLLFGDEALISFLTWGQMALDLAFISRPEVAVTTIPIMKMYSRETKIAYDTVDIHWKRLEQLQELSSPYPAAYTKYIADIEAFAIKHADLSVVVTPSDAAMLLTRAPGTHVATLANVIPQDHQELDHTGRRDLIFLGSRDHYPNVDAVRYFLEAIFPLLLNEIPDLKIHVVGFGFETMLELEEVPGVNLVGYVQDLEPWLDRSRVMIVPLRAGSGMKGKIGSAMSRGLPVVTTLVGAEGMELRHEFDALVADTPRDFADSVIRLIRDDILWSDIASNAKATVMRTSSPQVVSGQLQQIMESLKP